jgi:hypothetical protein
LVVSLPFEPESGKRAADSVIVQRRERRERRRLRPLRIFCFTHLRNFPPFLPLHARAAVPSFIPDSFFLLVLLVKRGVPYPSSIVMS